MLGGQTDSRPWQRFIQAIHQPLCPPTEPFYVLMSPNRLCKWTLRAVWVDPPGSTRRCLSCRWPAPKALCSTHWSRWEEEPCAPLSSCTHTAQHRCACSLLLARYFVSMAHTRHVLLQVPHGGKAVFFRIDDIKGDTRIRCVRLCAMLQELFAALQCTVTVPHKLVLLLLRSAVHAWSASTCSGRQVPSPCRQTAAWRWHPVSGLPVT